MRFCTVNTIKLGRIDQFRYEHVHDTVDVPLHSSFEIIGNSMFSLSKTFASNSVNFEVKFTVDNIIPPKDVSSVIWLADIFFSIAIFNENSHFFKSRWNKHFLCDLKVQ